MWVQMLAVAGCYFGHAQLNATWAYALAAVINEQGVGIHTLEPFTLF
jgi:hypothetical protein